MEHYRNITISKTHRLAWALHYRMQGGRPGQPPPSAAVVAAGKDCNMLPCMHPCRQAESSSMHGSCRVPAPFRLRQQQRMALFLSSLHIVQIWPLPHTDAAPLSCVPCRKEGWHGQGRDPPSRRRGAAATAPRGVRAPGRAVRRRCRGPVRTPRVAPQRPVSVGRRSSDAVRHACRKPRLCQPSRGAAAAEAGPTGGEASGRQHSTHCR